MRQKDIKLNTVYLARVGTKVARVQVYAECSYGRGRSQRQQWYATNIDTGRKVVVTAARLRAVYNPADPAHLRAVGMIPSHTVVGR